MQRMLFFSALGVLLLHISCSFVDKAPNILLRLSVELLPPLRTVDSVLYIPPLCIDLKLACSKNEHLSGSMQPDVCAQVGITLLPTHTFGCI